MPTNPRTVIAHLHDVLAADRGDRQLLAAFTAGDEAAFAELVRRHGPMVLGVCERVLGNRDDAEDAHQSTFLALARQADRADWRESLSGWLHDVAWRTATKLRMQNARQRAREQRVPLPSNCDVQERWPEVLDEEIRQLPPALREAVLCCYFQGLTRPQAAAKLGWSLRTLERRLEQGRRQLRKRLEARGELVPALLAGPALPLPSMLGRWWLLVGLVVVAGVGVVVLPRRAEPRMAAPLVAADPAEKEGALPVGAIARLGETKFRHGMMIDGMALSADGKVLATCDRMRSVCLWEVATGKLVRHIPDSSDSGCHVAAFSPDGKRIVTGLSPLRIVDVATGKVVRELRGHEHHWLEPVAWSDNGKWIASSCADHTLRIWDAETGQQLHLYKNHRRRSLAFSPGSKLLASVSSEGLHLFDPGTGKELARLDANDKVARSLTFSPDGKHLAFLDYRKGIVFWSMEDRSNLRTVQTNTRQCQTLAFTPDGRTLATGWKDGGIRLLDLTTGNELRRWYTNSDVVIGLLFSPGGKALFSCGTYESRIRRWDPNTGREIGAEDCHTGAVERLWVSRDGKSLLSFGLDCKIVRWDLATRTPTPLPLELRQMQSANVFSPDGKLLALGYDPASRKHKEITLFDTHTGNSRRLPLGYQDDTAGVAFSGNGKWVATVGEGEEVKCWDMATEKPLWVSDKVKPRRHYTIFTSRLRFSRDDRLLLCGGAGNGVNLYDATTGKLLRSYENRSTDEFEFAADFSPDGKLAAFPTGGANSPIVLWDTQTGKVQRTWRTDLRHGLTAVEFSPDGRLLATASAYSNPVRVWDVATGEEVCQFNGHQGVLTVAFTAAGRTLASGGGDSSVLLWDLTGRAGLVNPTLTPKRLRELWDLLAQDDVKKAYAATWELALSPDGAVPFLRSRLAPVKAADADVVNSLIQQLDADDFATRQAATRKLQLLGASALPRLRQRLHAEPSLEVRKRLEAIEAHYLRSDEWRRAQQVLAVLERGATPQGPTLIDELARGAENAPLTDEARAALRRRVPTK